MWIQDGTPLPKVTTAWNEKQLFVADVDAPNTTAGTVLVKNWVNLEEAKDRFQIPMPLVSIMARIQIRVVRIRVWWANHDVTTSHHTRTHTHTHKQAHKDGIDINTDIYNKGADSTGWGDISFHKAKALKPH